MLIISVSHPVWVRGLKLQGFFSLLLFSWSHPVWVRGLKQTGQFDIGFDLGVAPRVGAWIETFVKRKLFHKRYTYVMKYIFYGT